MTGRVGRMMCSACVVIYTFGTTITFLIVIGDQFDSTFNSIYGPEYSQKVKKVHLVTSLNDLWSFPSPEILVQIIVS